MKRSLDFSSRYRIEVVQSEVTGKYWGQVVNDGDGTPLWVMKGSLESRSEAFDLACNRLDALAEAYVSEGEQE